MALQDGFHLQDTLINEANEWDAHDRVNRTAGVACTGRAVPLR